MNLTSIFFFFSEKKKSKSSMKDMSAVVISESGTLYVADKTILVFNTKTGELCQELGRVKESSGGGGERRRRRLRRRLGAAAGNTARTGSVARRSRPTSSRKCPQVSRKILLTMPSYHASLPNDLPFCKNVQRCHFGKMSKDIVRRFTKNVLE